MWRIAPPLAALIYPLLVWAGPAISPWCLVLALAAPLVAAVGFRRLPPAAVRARTVALCAVGAPALYSWFGGLLDFQRALPVTSATLWPPLWIAAAIVAAREPASRPPAATRHGRLAVAHGLSAIAIVAFATAHVANHLAGLAGGAAHEALMRTLRLAYRAPALETLLLAAVGFQVMSGLPLLRRRVGSGGSWVDDAQTTAGAYLACFFASHLTAVLRARGRGVDTNWHWLTSDSLLSDPWSARLGPYYLLGVIALGVHAAAGLRHVLIARGHAISVVDRWFTVATAASVVIAALIMTGLLRG